MTPRAPSETRAASKMSRFLSASHSRISPLVVASLSAVTSAWIATRVLPVPWVAVLSAPPSDCLLMSGRLAIARPLAARAGPSWPRRVPHQTTAWSSPSQPAIPARPSSDIRLPAVGTRAVKEWPAPTARIGPGAVFSAWATSSSDFGASRACG